MASPVAGSKRALGILRTNRQQRLVLVHADHRIVVAGHPDVGNERRAARQDLMVGGGRMGVGADHQAGAAVAEMPHGLLLARRLAVNVDDDRVGRGVERTGGKLAIDRGEWIIERVHEDAAHSVDDEHARAVLGFDSATPRPGVPAGKLTGRSSFGARSMKTSASF